MPPAQRSFRRPAQRRAGRPGTAKPAESAAAAVFDRARPSPVGRGSTRGYKRAAGKVGNRRGVLIISALGGLRFLAWRVRWVWKCVGHRESGSVSSSSSRVLLFWGFLQQVSRFGLPMSERGGDSTPVWHRGIIHINRNGRQVLLFFLSSPVSRPPYPHFMLINPL